MDASIVESDSFDQRTFAEILKGSARLSQIQHSGERILPHFDALLFDLYCALFKLNVVLRPPDVTPQTTRLARRFLGGLLEAEHFQSLREKTALDEFRSAMGAARLGEELLRAIAREEWLDPEELARLRALADREGEIDDLREQLRTLEDLGRDKGTAGQDLRREIDVIGDEIADLGEHHQESVDEIPPNLEGLVERQTERLGLEVEQAEERLESWGSGMGAPDRLSAAERLELGDRLLRSKNLQRLAKLVGSMRHFALAERRRRFERAVEEIHEVRKSGDLGRVLPAELANLRHPVRRLEFLRRFAEADLLAYNLRGQSELGRGPMVVCLDGSSSMAGDKELWSKAVALTLLEIARRDGRAFRVIYFSSRDAVPKEFDCLPRARPGRKAVGRLAVDFPEVVGLCEYFPGGGTDFERPLRRALDSLGESRFRRGDVVLITDGECAVSDSFKSELAHAKHHLEARLFAVEVDVGTHTRGTLAEIADRLTTVTQLTNASLRDLFLEI